jgi:hypothetical protein
MSKVAISGNTSGTGVFTVASPNSNVDRVLTLPDETGTVLTTTTPGVPVNGPAFSAYNSTAQTISNDVFTKCALNGEAFDTNSNFDNETNYRFTPTVAGYYQFSAKLRSHGSSSLTRVLSTLYKNGATTGRLFDMEISFGTSVIIVSGSDLLYMNGSTDYVELYVYLTGTGTLTIGASDTNTTHLMGFLARSAT